MRVCRLFGSVRVCRLFASVRVCKLFGSVRVCKLFGWSWASLLALGFLASRALPVCIFDFGLCDWSWFPGLLLLLLLLGSVAVAVAVVRPYITL